jgi:phosphoketolase
MSAIVRDDTYGPQNVRIVHSNPDSSVGRAIAMVKGEESTLAVALATEAEFDDPDFFDVHRASLVDPLRDGVALAIIHAAVNGPESTDDAMAREDLLRAAGYAAYTLDLDGTIDDRTAHRHLAGLLEDVFDEIAGIKADAAARILSGNPLWPAVVIRTFPAWRQKHGLVAATDEQPLKESH